MPHVNILPKQNVDLLITYLANLWRKFYDWKLKIADQESKA